MPGYAPDFLAASFAGDHPRRQELTLPLPRFDASLEFRVVRRPELAEDVYAHYVNYTVAMHAGLRTPVFSALNIEQTLLKSVERTDNWRVDSRIGAEFQLNNDYYRGRDNPWDRGHLARRASAAWGPTRSEAQHASDDTFFYSNACLQHRNFNQDEWLALESWVKDMDEDATDRISVFSGPVFGNHPRSITPAGRETALIPAAFFKVVAWVHGEGELAVRAFLMAQDAEAIHDQGGAREIRESHGTSALTIEDFQRYQVTVAEIERETGLVFPPQIGERNPLFFFPRDIDKEQKRFETAEAEADRLARAAKLDALNVRRLPERIEVDAPREVVRPDEVRLTIRDDEVAVFIAAALVNAAGPEAEGEWVSVINLAAGPVDLAGWELRDPQDAFALSGSLGPGEARRFGPIAPIRLGNNGGTIALFNAEGERIDRVKYPPQLAEDEGRPVIFAMRDLTMIA